MGRLVRRELAPHQLSSLIEVILSSSDGDEVIHNLPGNDVQTFVDVIDEARPAFIGYRLSMSGGTHINLFWELGNGWI